MCFKLTWKSQIICFLISFISVNLIEKSANEILSNFFMQPFIFYPSNNVIINFYIYVLILMIPISIVHEIIHGIAYTLYGGKVKFGFKGIYAYTQEISGKPIRRTSFLIVLLCPLTIISILSLLLPQWLGGMVFLLNLLGASGDIYMSLFLVKFNYNSSIIDRKYGFDVMLN